MIVFNATDTPLEVAGKVLIPGKGLDVQVTDDLRTALDVGILTDFWPAPVSSVKGKLGRGVHKIKTLLAFF